MARSSLRWAARLLIAIGAIMAVPVWAMGVPSSAGAAGSGATAVQVAVTSAVPAHAVSPGIAHAVPPGAGGVSPGTAGPGVQAVLTAAHAPSRPGAPSRPDAPAGGVCSVPGIGDIGGLLGLCSAGSSGIIGALNNVCQPSLPQPEPATGGIDALIQPPAGVASGNTLYDNYGVAGQFWAAHGLQCSDMTSLIGNNVAGMVFDAAKSIDRVTITVYQSAAGNGILNWLQSVVDRLISALGNAIYFPYLAPVIILGAIWLAWNGLVRKRATRAIEGTLWMVVACAAAIWLIGRPADFTGVGTTVSNGVTQVLNVAFAKLPNPGGSNCVPVQGGDPQASGNFGFTSSNGLVDSNANELWAVLVCKPWLDGELGTTQYATSAKAPQTVVNTYGRQLLWAQAIAANEHPSADLIQAKQATYNGIANSLQQNNPSVYALFQGNQWTTRLEVGFAALFAALVAGLLILLIALTLIILKLGFLLLLIAGPFFLIIGTHPGFGRIIAIRWFEMLVGVLMKQVAVALALSVLLYAYSLIMGTSDAVLPWALKILMIALVTVAVFIYRKPFQHLFSAVGYGVIGSQERADISLRQAGTTFRRVTRDTATVTVPGVAAYRVGRWARRNPGEAAALAAGVVGAAGAVSAGAAASKVAAAQAAGAGAGAGAPGGVPEDAAARARAGADGSPPDADPAAQASQGLATAERVKRWPGDDDERRSAPPLNLPPRAGAAEGAPASGWSRTGAQAGTAARSGEAPPRPGSAVRVTPAPSAAQPAASAGRPGPAASAGRPGPAAPAGRPGPAAPAGRPGPATAAGGSSATSRSGGSWWPTAGRSAGGARPSRPAASSGPAPAAAPPPASPPAFGGRPAAPRNGSGGNGSGGNRSSGNGSGGNRSGGNGSGGNRSGGNGSGGGSGPRTSGPAGGPWSGATARPRWQPGPIRPSGGWAGRTRAPESPESPAPPARGSRSPGSARSGSARSAGRPPSGGDRARARDTSGWSGPSAGRVGPGSSGSSGPAGSGNGRDGGAEPPEAPLPFWLRPVRRRK